MSLVMMVEHALSDESDDKDYIVSGKIEPLPEPNQSYISLISPPPSPSRSTNTENKFDEIKPIYRPRAEQQKGRM